MVPVLVSRPPSTSTVPSWSAATTSGKAGPGIGAPPVQVLCTGSYSTVCADSCPVCSDSPPKIATRPSGSATTLLVVIGAGGPACVVQLPTVEKASWQLHIASNA